MDEKPRLPLRLDWQPTLDCGEPYTRAEVLRLRKFPPERGWLCPGCSAVVPCFADLSEEDERRILFLIRDGRPCKAAQELEGLTGCWAEWSSVWVAHKTVPRPFKRHGDCPYCGKPLRTGEAKQCPHCRRDWHDSHNVRKLGLDFN